MKSRFQRSLSAFAFTFFLGVGTYNAVVINSESSIDGANIKFVKRLDELYGVNEPGRLVANSLHWQKLPRPEQKTIQEKAIVQEVRTIMAAPDVSASAPVETPTAAAVQEELDLSLVEVVNPKKWQQGLKNDQFSGALTTSNGSIESLNVSLPQGEGLSISFSEMAGNVFEYDLNGEIYSGMMYQVDQNSYMITLTNGPLEGTRLKFMGVTPAQAEETVAQQGTNSESDNYGNNSEQTPEYANNDQAAVEPNQVQAQEAPPSDFQPAEVQPVEQPQDVAFEDSQAAQDASNMDLQFQQQAQAFNLEQSQVN